MSLIGVSVEQLIYLFLTSYCLLSNPPRTLQRHPCPLGSQNYLNKDGCGVGSGSRVRNVVYYKSINRDLKKRCINECRCDERCVLFVWVLFTVSQLSRLTLDLTVLVSRIQDKFPEETIQAIRKGNTVKTTKHNDPSDSVDFDLERKSFELSIVVKILKRPPPSVGGTDTRTRHFFSLHRRWSYSCLWWIDEVKANIKPIYECRCNGRLYEKVYYESINREPKIRGIKKCRCDERLQTKTKEFTRLPYTG